MHVSYDAGIDRLVVTFDSGVGITLPLRSVTGLENATAAELERAEMSPSGLGIHFPHIDADVYLPALLDDLLGASRWAARRNGKAGGKAATEAKSKAARANGRLGGRPKKAGTTPIVATDADAASDAVQASVKPADRL